MIDAMMDIAEGTIRCVKCLYPDLYQNNFLLPRLNRTVKIEQMRTKYDEYSSFKLCVPTYLKNKVLDKNFWGNNDIYVRNFVQKRAINDCVLCCVFVLPHSILKLHHLIVMELEALLIL